MEQSFLQQLFKFTLAHSYYKNNMAGIFEIEPMPESHKILTAHKLHFKKQEKGFMIAAECFKPDTDGITKPMTPFVEGEKLSFAIFANDPYFMDNSNLPLDPPGSYIYYFNNLNESKRTSTLLLNKSGIKESERMLLHDKRFAFDILVDQSTSIDDEGNEVPCEMELTPKLFDIHGNEIILEEGKEINYDLANSKCLLDFSEYKDGVYTIKYGNETTTYYCTKASLIRRIPIIILEIFTGEDVPESLRIIKHDEIEGQYIEYKEFGLHFGEYSFYWRYRVLPENIHHPLLIKIKSNDETVSFLPEEEWIRNDTGEIIFTSSQELDISDENLELGLYLPTWNNHCLWNNKYYYCGEKHGIYIDDHFKCRKYSYKKGQKWYEHECPAVCSDMLVGVLPKPETVPTMFVRENDKLYAVMTVYIVYDYGTHEFRLETSELFDSAEVG